MAKQTLIVMSDSHSDRAIVEEIKNHYLGKVDAIFHNGDSELRDTDPIWEDIRVVGGNMDFYLGYPDSLVTDLDGLRVAQAHGHLFSINFNFDRLIAWAQEENADICLYGHLHLPTAWMEGKTLFLNPGSISQPRGSIQEKLYAKIEVDEETFKVDFYNRSHQLYPSLSKEFRR